ncbi:MAG TPA: hypothetical protein VFY23_11640 [Candidatus Limnocylindrales bacterium]|nr:hypothetical protein [Candidatus Limnocylindrales bacterium]
MAIHQPALTPHHIPRWAEDALAAILGAVILFGLLLVAGHADLLPQSAAPVSRALLIEGRTGGGIVYTGIPYPAPVSGALVIEGRTGGGIVYTGIPYPAPKPAWIVEGRTGGGIVYTGIPDPAPADQ